MVTDARITADRFADQKLDLPEAGRWHELHEGIPTVMEPPDDDHGNAVLNLSRALADWFQQLEAEAVGYACHEIGLKTEEDPDTVLFPAITVFRAGNRFQQSDNIIATHIPDVVIDIASTNDRRRDMRRRTLGYIGAGAKSVWVPDPMKKEVQIIVPGAHTLALAGKQLVESQHILPGFQISCTEVFAQPEWWR